MGGMGVKELEVWAGEWRCVGVGVGETGGRRLCSRVNESAFWAGGSR